MQSSLCFFFLLPLVPFLKLFSSHHFLSKSCWLNVVFLIIDLLQLDQVWSIFWNVMTLLVDFTGLVLKKTFFVLVLRSLFTEIYSFFFKMLLMCLWRSINLSWVPQCHWTTGSCFLRSYVYVNARHLLTSLYMFHRKCAMRMRLVALVQKFAWWRRKDCSPGVLQTPKSRSTRSTELFCKILLHDKGVLCTFFWRYTTPPCMTNCEWQPRWAVGQPSKHLQRSDLAREPSHFELRDKQTNELNKRRSPNGITLDVFFRDPSRIESRAFKRRNEGLGTGKIGPLIIIGSAEALPILCVRYFRWERERERERERDTQRERERERERRKWRHHCRAKIGDEFTLSLAKNSHNWRWAYTFPCQKFALFVSPFTEIRRGHHCGAEIRMSSHFPLPTFFSPSLLPLFQMARAARRVIENPRQMIKSCPVLFCSSHRKNESN